MVGPGSQLPRFLMRFSTLSRFGIVGLLGLAVLSCNRQDDILPGGEAGHSTVAARIAAGFPETFDTGTKGSYAVGSVTLNTGAWTLDDALLGNSASDPKTGTQSVRMRNVGTLGMGFDLTTGAGTVTVAHAYYGTDGASQWELWMSTNAGSTYAKVGATQTAATGTLQTATFTVNQTGTVRFQIRKTSGGTLRLNIDDVNITAYSGAASDVATTLSGSATATAGSTVTYTATTVNNGPSPVTGTIVTLQLVPTLPAASVTVTGGSYNAATGLVTFATTASLATGATQSNTVAWTAPASGTVSGKAASSSAVSDPTPANNNGTAAGANLTTTISGGGTAGTKFLFDATHAEMAGNADWVPDVNSGVASRFPTPAASGITSTTAQSYWTGGLSAWAVALVKLGNSVETLPAGTAITYGNTSNAQDLANYTVFIVDEPNKRFTTAEKTAILQFVQNGGGLFMISDHDVSDRDNDGWDSPAIWNDLMTTNSVQTNPFGFSIALTNISETSSNVRAGANPILNGSQGVVTNMKFSNGATITTNSGAAQNLIWRSSSSQGTSNGMCASSTFGAGRVVVVADSSPADDGSASPNNTVFPGWTELVSHSRLHLNASLWLAKQQ